MPTEKGGYLVEYDEVLIQLVVIFILVGWI
jgi:hypothetical protein